LIRFGDCELDLAGYEVRRSGQRCAVEPRVFELLAYLVCNAGRLVTKDELIAKVWGGRIVSDAALSGQIKSARHAIGDDGEQQRLIRTVHGRGFRFIGEVKHAEQPQGEEPRVAEERTLPLPDKPSIAVLPFTNMSGDPEQDYFADGMVEEIITALSHFPRLFVIARNSSFTYKGRPGIDIREVGRELGVRYVLEGSVRKAGERVRIAGQLIDASSGAHLWADRFDGVLADIFDLQDTVARSVVGAIEPRLMAAEVERAQRKRTASLDAYDLYLRALPNVLALTRESTDAGLALIAQALAIDPDYAVAAGLAGWCYVIRVSQRWQVDSQTEMRAGTELGHRAIAKGPSDPEALAMGGLAIALLGEEFRAGLDAIERAIALNPNSAWASTAAGWVHTLLGDAATGVAMYERAVRLSPRDPTISAAYSGLAFAHLVQEHFDEAVLWAQRGLAANPNSTTPLRALAAALAHLGRTAEARAAMERLRALTPDETLTSYTAWVGKRWGGRLPLILEGLRRAGLPE
jgi:TolB-like protein/Flp pilus assembly protein TadD